MIYGFSYRLHITCTFYVQVAHSILRDTLVAFFRLWSYAYHTKHGNAWNMRLYAIRQPLMDEFDNAGLTDLQNAEQEMACSCLPSLLGAYDALHLPVHDAPGTAHTARACPIFQCDLFSRRLLLFRRSTSKSRAALRFLSGNAAVRC